MKKLGLVLLVVSAISAHAQGTMRLGDVAINAGVKTSLTLKVPDAADKGVEIPVSVIRGTEPGPVLALIAGTHGYEYTSILALHQVLQQLDPSKMKGAVILVHMANPETFYGRRVYWSSDGKNLNRVYPGKKDGTISDRIAEVITREVIDQSTHLIDMHSGDGNESLRPYSYWMTGTDPKIDAQSKQLNLAYGLDHIVIDHDRPKDVKDSRYTAMTAILRGKPAITAESGGMGLTDEASVQAHVRGAMSVINHLGIMKGPSAMVARPIWYGKSEVLTAPVTGIWQSIVDKDAVVSQGTLIGQVRDAFGKSLAEVRAPFGGTMLYVVGTPPVMKGEPVAFVAVPTPDGK
jgi:predicted deacylase